MKLFLIFAYTLPFLAKGVPVAHIEPKHIPFIDETLEKLFRNDTHIVLGGRNHAYFVNISSFNLTSILNLTWNASKEAIDSCRLIYDVDCNNTIEVYYELDDGFVLCGTHATKPSCRIYPQDSPHNTSTLYSGFGLAPFEPKYGLKFLTTDEYIFTATSNGFTKSDSFLQRKLKNPTKGKSESDKRLRTPKDYAFTRPTFIHMHRHDEQVFVWLTETQSGAGKQSQIARICETDPGAVRPYEEEFSSFSKVEILCEFTTTDEERAAFKFKNLVSVHDFNNGSHAFGVFNIKVGEKNAFAICEYDLDRIAKLLSDNFKYNGTRCARATSRLDHLRNREQSFVHKAFSATPLYFDFSNDFFFTSLAYLPNYRDFQNKTHKIFWFGDNKGFVHTFKKTDQNDSLIKIDVISDVSSSAIRELILVKREQNSSLDSHQLVIVAASDMYLISAVNCSAKKTKENCQMHPMCVWDYGLCKPKLHTIQYFRTESDSVNLTPEKFVPATTAQSKSPKNNEPDQTHNLNLTQAYEAKNADQPSVTQIVHPKINEFTNRIFIGMSCFILVFGFLMGASTVYLVEVIRNRRARKDISNTGQFRPINAFEEKKGSPSLEQSFHSTSSKMVELRSPLGHPTLCRNTYC